MEQKLGEFWPKIENLKKPLLLRDLDFAVRENVKVQLQNLITNNMTSFIERGLTYEELEKFQKELELCPTLLECYPKKKSSLLNWIYQTLENCNVKL